MAIQPTEQKEIMTVNIADAKQMRESFDKFKRSVLTPDDFYEQKGKKYVRKSGWMMYATALNISTDVFDERSEVVKFKGQEVYVYHFTAKATAPSGRYAVAVGSASSDEGKPWCDAIHSIRAMAQTRATERSISNLIGGGEVGAEEMDTKSVDAEYKVRDNPPLSRSMSDAEVTGEQDIIDTISNAGLDPNGVEIVTRDFGKFIIKPIWPKPVSEADNPWRKYNDALKPLGAVYHKKDDPNEETRYNWTVGM